MGDAAEGGAPDAPEEVPAAVAAPRVEALASITTIRNNLPIFSDDVESFHCPEGWSEDEDEDRWVERGASGAPRECSSRAELEEMLERDAVNAGRTWFGQLVAGRWELRSRDVTHALAQAHARVCAASQSEVLARACGAVGRS